MVISAPSVSSREPFGTTARGEPVELVTLADGDGLEAALMSYGAAIQRLSAPDREGRLDDVVLGFPTLEGYLAGVGHYFGATVGRYANRIAGARVRLDGAVHALVPNEGANSLHGGPAGFDKRVWRLVASEAGPESARAVFAYTSPDGEMGFPGTLELETTYTLSGGGALEIAYRATTDRPTVVNLTNHALWNLAGEGEGTVDGHLLTVFASAYTPVDAELIPSGEIDPVAGTPLDFRCPTPVGARIGAAFGQLRLAGGYDHNFVLDRSDPSSLARAARLEEPRSGRVLELATTEPGLQVYSGNFLDDTLVGPSGRAYGPRAGIALETQHFPDSPGHENFPSTVLRPGETLESRSLYRLTLMADAPLDRGAGNG